jgi:hypothetical protein
MNMTYLRREGSMVSVLPTSIPSETDWHWMHHTIRSWRKTFAACVKRIRKKMVTGKGIFIPVPQKSTSIGTTLSDDV